MKTKLVTICWVVGTFLGSSAVRADEDPNTGLPQPVIFVKDSPITTAVETNLVAADITGVVSIHVETDENGVVWLTGSVRTPEAADRVASIARETEHVMAVYNDLKINKGDLASG